ncbi:putative inactive heme oxygenase 2 chloroplastic [Prunus yedoensis var. nudiflora]|uniref:Putative inactive heme oxygenase 2 chloroplastic n=1 Tax=Prunus yedoensis var. nudiflora TaxID=2094558 RepID=A0A314ZWN6_PRUYE|nr:putative inactive heme oxygenase 2 chloroplastic [Prunus yedoensis var. nudiflora]
MRYRKQYPGESKGITEEMRFVAMRLQSDVDGDGGEAETWRPSMEGFLKYLVDSKLVFDTVERIVDDSNDVACQSLSFVSEKLLEGRELGFYTWEGDVQELLKGVREKLNKLGEHWTRDDKNKCLRETTKSFRHLGQIVRLIILELK